MYFSTYLLQDQAKWDFSRLEQMNAKAFCLAHISIALALPSFIHIRVFHSFPGSQYVGITQHHAARLKRRIHPLEADSAPPASRFSLNSLDYDDYLRIRLNLWECFTLEIATNNMKHICVYCIYMYLQYVCCCSVGCSME